MNRPLPPTAASSISRPRTIDPSPRQRNDFLMSCSTSCFKSDPTFHLLLAPQARTKENHRDAITVRFLCDASSCPRTPLLLVRLSSAPSHPALDSRLPRGIWHSPLIPAALALTVGILLDRHLSLPMPVSLIAAAACLAAWFCAGQSASRLAVGLSRAGRRRFRSRVSSLSPRFPCGG